MTELSFFDEKRGVVAANFEWGQWWQTVHELHLKIPLPPGTKSKQVSLTVKPSYISLAIAGKTLLQGNLARTVVADDTVWTIEDGFLCVVLSNAKFSVGEEMWESLLADGSFAPDPLIFHEMRKNLDLEKFQIENPGFDFSRAKLDKAYDKMPKLSHDRTEEFQEKRRLQAGNSKES